MNPADNSTALDEALMQHPGLLVVLFVVAVVLAVVGAVVLEVVERRGKR
jgi:uncharacterized membrane protein YoaK (UPF0700 family)